MTFTDIQAYLRHLSDKHDLITLAIKSCEELIDNLIQESGTASMGGFSKGELKLEFKSQELLFRHYLQQEIIIQTQIGIYINDPTGIWLRNLESVGRYILETNESGQPVDDWFLLNQDKREEIDSISSLRDLNFILPATGLQRNSPYYDYISYVHHAVALYQSQQYDAAALFIEKPLTTWIETISSMRGKSTLRRVNCF